MTKTPLSSPGQHHEPGKRRTLDADWHTYLKATSIHPPSRLVQGKALSRGIKLFNARQFFDSHEAFEITWKASQYPEKLFLLSLIKLSVAFVHIERGKIRTALKLVNESLNYMSTFPSVYLGIDTARLEQNVQEWVRGQAISADPDIPSIFVLDACGNR
jgi:predicted metal-dependent hydrolase